MTLEERCWLKVMNLQLEQTTSKQYHAEIEVLDSKYEMKKILRQLLESSTSPARKHKMFAQDSKINVDPEPQQLFLHESSQWKAMQEQFLAKVDLL